MKKLLILSGKGGTGKTTTAAAFIKFSKSKAYADCDVDAPNLHLITKTNLQPLTTDYYGSKKAVIDNSKCINCGLCEKYCRFNAISCNNNNVVINKFECEGCDVCAQICPTKAISLCDYKSGQLLLYKDEKIFSTAELNMGSGNTGKLVTEVKSALLQSKPKGEIIIIDGSPGIGCPVIASINGVDMVLIVTEPSLSGLSDLKRIAKVCKTMCVKTAVCINKFDTNKNNSQTIKEFCVSSNIPIVGLIPYDNNVSIAINKCMSIADIDCCANTAFKEAFNNTMQLLKNC